MDNQRSDPVTVRWTRELEGASLLDVPVRAARVLAEQVIASPSRRRVLQGERFGHGLHPMLTDFPLGAWMSATALDFIGGRQSRSASTRLIGLGLVAATPTALTGLAEWGEVHDQRVDRVGLVHAVTNLGAVALYGGSFVARLRGRTASGRVLAVTGGMAAVLGGYLGGHLTEVRKVGSYHPGFDE